MGHPLVDCHGLAIVGCRLNVFALDFRPIPPRFSQQGLDVDIAGIAQLQPVDLVIEVRRSDGAEVGDALPHLGLRRFLVGFFQQFAGLDRSSQIAQHVGQGVEHLGLPLVLGKQLVELVLTLFLFAEPVADLAEIKLELVRFAGGRAANGSEGLFRLLQRRVAVSGILHGLCPLQRDHAQVQGGGHDHALLFQLLAGGIDAGIVVDVPGDILPGHGLSFLFRDKIGPLKVETGRRLLLELIHDAILGLLDGAFKCPFGIVKGIKPLVQIGTQQRVGLVELALGRQGLTEQAGPFAIAQLLAERREQLEDPGARIVAAVLFAVSRLGVLLQCQGQLDGQFDVVRIGSHEFLQHGAADRRDAGPIGAGDLGKLVQEVEDFARRRLRMMLHPGDSRPGKVLFRPPDRQTV